MTTYTSELWTAALIPWTNKHWIYVNNDIKSVKKKKKLRLNSFNQCKLIERAGNKIKNENIYQNYSKQTYNRQSNGRKKYFTLVVSWLFCLNLFIEHTTLSNKSSYKNHMRPFDYFQNSVATLWHNNVRHQLYIYIYIYDAMKCFVSNIFHVSVYLWLYEVVLCRMTVLDVGGVCVWFS